ncbi:UPF0565 protein C2orf69 homolog [Acanthaster planci]|uniref:UPF0565 protein C2orf69 homolog n=1 Tax=Acanthaster planci TaxID=133434 RepID=A0A8B7ZYK3_ACAPL|nr:UPF0565 protein C2orf69 homolog [Acanthaster planci]XP_022109829.1 UPF0565 protein C2orf69 homolog [Acanthaster planci]XP_022109830.1 UPF0565 protein C2orf69 homolog [Acanthaster planci]
MAHREFMKGLTFMTLKNVTGVGSRENDILFSTVVNGSNCKHQRETAQGHVVFFPGDTQNFHEVMMNHLTNKKWASWSYENTSALLHQRFFNSYVWLIKPSRIHENTFSCYDNFLQSTTFGAPASFENFESLLHLRHILLSAISLVNTRQGNAMSVQPLSKDTPLSIIGFSKGCVVLNQFLYELESAKKNPELSDFLKLTSAFYWLDAGHSLTSRIWITDEKLLQQLTDSSIRVRVHVSPRQVRDPGRPYIGEEERVFVEVLKRQGADIQETLHFTDQERSMEQHFRILEQF